MFVVLILAVIVIWAIVASAKRRSSRRYNARSTPDSSPDPAVAAAMNKARQDVWRRQAEIQKHAQDVARQNQQQQAARDAAYRRSLRRP
jgi:hypothetical protein